MPEADDEEHEDDGAARYLKPVPDGWLEPGDEEGREEERDRREDGLLHDEVFAPVGFDELVDAAVEARLDNRPPKALRVLVVRVEDRADDEVVRVDSLELVVVV